MATLISKPRLEVSASRGSSPWLLYTARQRWGYLAILFLVSTSNYIDRMVVWVLLEPIKMEFQVSDTMLGLLTGFSFALFYAVGGIPVARWADRGNRRTIITLALSVWSVMTMLCGIAHSFWQLLLTRVGVGVGESGAVPPAQSLIVDYFPPERRATALAIFGAAGAVGYAIGMGGGGYIAEAYGWRSAFWVMGLPGLILALIVRFTLAEPRTQLGVKIQNTTAERLRDTLSTLWRKRSFVCAVVGYSLYAFVTYGALAFMPSFMVRVLQVPLVEASTALAATGTVITAIGTIGGGTLTDWMARRDIRWLAWLPALACTIAAPLYLLAFSMHSLWSFLILVNLAYLSVCSGMPGVFAGVLTVCGSSRRAMAIAIVLFSSTLFGTGLGPVVSGALSDALSVTRGIEGLRYALMAAITALVPAGALFFLFGRALYTDREA